MNKLLFILTASLFVAMSIYSQAPKKDVPAVSGNYSFSKAALTIRNYHTKAQVLSQDFNDLASLKGLSNISFPPQPVFLLARIHQGVLSFCKLWNNNKEYHVLENGQLLVPIDWKEDSKEDFSDTFLQPYRLPLFTIKEEGKTISFTFTIPFGSSAYSFPLEGEFMITMVKDEPN